MNRHKLLLYIKSNIKSFFVGSIIAFIISVSATATLTSSQIEYKSGTSVETALNELYQKTNELGLIAGCNGCTKLEYLESTGSQYIDTEYTPNSEGYIAEGRLRFIGEQKVWATVLGNFVDDPEEAAKFGKKEDTDHWSTTFGDDTESEVSFSVDTDYNFEVSFIVGNKYLKINNETVISNNDTSNIPNRSLYIFSYNREGIGDSEAFAGRIYNVKIYSSGSTLVRNYIPVLDSNDRPCLFDKVSKTCFYNQGEGEFLYG